MGLRSLTSARGAPCTSMAGSWVSRPGCTTSGPSQLHKPFSLPSIRPRSRMLLLAKLKRTWQTRPLQLLATWWSRTRTWKPWFAASRTGMSASAVGLRDYRKTRGKLKRLFYDLNFVALIYVTVQFYVIKNILFKVLKHL